MRYVVSGATSGTGNSVIRRLTAAVGASRITCLVRPTSETSLLQRLGLRLHVGEVTDVGSLAPILDRSSVYVDMTHPKFYHRSLEAVMRAGVERAFFVTTTGIFSRYNHLAEIYRTNEARIRASGIAYTILRPSMIYGSLRDKNMHRLIRHLSRCPVFPLFAGGRSLMQPVFVEDLAEGIVTAILSPGTENQEYNLAGPRPIRFREIAEIVLEKLHRRVLLVPINARLAELAARHAQRIPGFPITEEQVLRLREDKVFDISRAVAELDFCPRGFENGIALEIAEMRAAGIIR